MKSIWAIELTKRMFSNKDILLLCIKDYQGVKNSNRDGLQCSLLFVNVISEVPCALGIELPVSQVDEKAIQQEEEGVKCSIMRPILEFCRQREVDAEYCIERHDHRRLGLLNAVTKYKPEKVYLQVKKKMFGRGVKSVTLDCLEQNLPHCVTIVGTKGGQRLAEVCGRLNQWSSENISSARSPSAASAHGSNGNSYMNDALSEWMVGSPESGRNTPGNSSLTASPHAREIASRSFSLGAHSPLFSGVLGSSTDSSSGVRSPLASSASPSSSFSGRIMSPALLESAYTGSGSLTRPFIRKQKDPLRMDSGSPEITIVHEGSHPASLRNTIVDALSVGPPPVPRVGTSSGSGTLLDLEEFMAMDRAGAVEN